jgi:hypothetical protein
MSAREQHLEILIRRLANAMKRMRRAQKGSVGLKAPVTQGDRVKAEQEADTILLSIEDELKLNYGTAN